MKNSWLFPVIQAIHVIGLALSVGMIALEDFAQFRSSLRGLPSLFRPTLAGFAVTFVTGLALFLADRARYLANPAFFWKIALLAVALAIHFTIRRHPSRFAAGLSLALWTAVVLASRAIADFDV